MPIPVVLDNLGTSLRGTLKKIANAPYVDKTLIKEVVRDVQRALCNFPIIPIIIPMPVDINWSKHDTSESD